MVRSLPRAEQRNSQIGSPEHEPNAEKGYGRREHSAKAPSEPGMQRGSGQAESKDQGSRPKSKQKHEEGAMPGGTGCDRPRQSDVYKPAGKKAIDHADDKQIAQRSAPQATHHDLLQRGHRSGDPDGKPTWDSRQEGA